MKFLFLVFSGFILGSVTGYYFFTMQPISKQPESPVVLYEAISQAGVVETINILEQFLVLQYSDAQNKFITRKIKIHFNENTKIKKVNILNTDNPLVGEWEYQIIREISPGSRVQVWYEERPDNFYAVRINYNI